MSAVKKFILLFLVLLLTLGISESLLAADGLEVTPSVDFVSRYIWRGLMINDAPNIQPSVTVGFNGLEIGVWGSSTLAKTNSTEDNYTLSHEVDFWAGYTLEMSNGMSVGAIVTDYYFPNAGIKFGNFNNYDDPEGAGAHVVEAGLTIGGPESFPLSLSAYMNVYNDAGNNTYFQLDYSKSIADVDMDFFIGASAGSEDNPAYYGTDALNVINLGCTAHKSLKFSESFSLPVSISLIANPRQETTFVICGFSL